MGQVARVYQAKGTLVLQLPQGQTERVDGVPVCAPSECFLAFEQYPSFVRALQTYWVDVSSHPNAEIAKNWFGNAVDYHDMEAGASVHTIRRSLWLREPTIGRSFYGLVSYRDDATPSDMLKDRSLVNLNTGTIARQHLKWYLSFPIRSIRQVECNKSLRETCQSSAIPLEQKAEDLFRLLRKQNMPQ